MPKVRVREQDWRVGRVPIRPRHVLLGVQRLYEISKFKIIPIDRNQHKNVSPQSLAGNT